MLHDPSSPPSAVGADQYDTVAQPDGTYVLPGFPSTEAIAEAARDMLYRSHYANTDYQSSFASWKEASRTHRSKLISALQNTYQLYIHMQADLDRAREDLRRECEHHEPEIPIQSNSNDLLLLVKLTFDDTPKRASKIACAMLFALVCNTPPFDLPNFLKTHGGIEGCANELARFKRERSSSTASSGQPSAVTRRAALPVPKTEWPGEVRRQLADLRGTSSDSVSCTLKAVIAINGVIKITEVI